MENPIIATTLSGLFIKSEPWKQTHTIWFEDMAKKLNDPSINEWASKSNYFEGVSMVMERLYPDLSDEQRTTKARELFFDSVYQYIQENPQVKNQEVIDYFSSLKEKFRLALITTNTPEVVNKILSLTGLVSFFDIVESSKPHEKDDKGIVFDRFIKVYGKPVIYIGGDKKDSFDYCAKHNILCIFANLEGDEELNNVKTIHNLNELKGKIENL